MLSNRDNFLRTIELRCPEWIPISFDLPNSVRFRYGTQLAELMRRHPLIFSPQQADAAEAVTHSPGDRRERRFVDDWGCQWLEIEPGILGQVVDHPLADWADLDRLNVPDPARQWDWEAIRARCRQQRERGELACGYMDVVRSGFFDRLQFLRGLDNLLVDFIERPPELARLMEVVLDYNLRLIRLWLDAGVEVLTFHGDIGTQKGLMMSPALFRDVLKPTYARMFRACRNAGVHVGYSSDGCLLEIIDEMVECGVSYHDPQVGACGIESIARAYRGKLCAMVDIDEQMLPFARPDEITSQIREIVARVGCRAGGLMLYACPSADVPLENIEAICVGWEQYAAPGRWQTLVYSFAF